MCGIIGYHSLRPLVSHFGLIIDLFLQSKIRGLHAFGIAYYLNSQLCHFKSTKLDDVLNHIRSFKQFPNMLIGHCRYTTCDGDWDNNVNNQPTVAYDMAHVFNGVISMESQAVYEKQFGHKYETGNDGEIIMRWLKDGGTAESFFGGKKYSYAGIWLKDGKIFAFRNPSRPMWCVKSEEFTIVGSTKDIFNRATQGTMKPHPVVCNKTFELQDIEIQCNLLSYNRDLGSSRIQYGTRVV
jgi:glutamine phosphoribosylpyrophosphate amidotransferase